MTGDLNSINSNLPYTSGELRYHLFGGEHDFCLPGMDGYVGQYDDIEHAMKVAEGNQYDWSHIVKVTPLELKIVNVGRWNNGLKTMVWQADFAPMSKRDLYLKTFCSVMKTGVLLVGELSCNRDRIPKARLVVMTNALNLHDEIQAGLGSMTAEAQGVAVYLVRQIIAQMVVCMHRAGMSYKEKQKWDRWCTNANGLLDTTKQMNFADERLEAV